jgi:hypothetical protein
MDSRSWDRWGAAGGIVSAVLFVIAFAIEGRSPDHKDANEKFVAYVLGHHTRLLASAIFAGLALIAFLWFLGSLVKAMRDAGQGRLGTIAFGGGLVFASLALVGRSIETGLAYRVALDDPSSVKVWWDVSAVVVTLIGFPVGAMVLAAASASLQSRFLPAWYGWASGVIAVALVLRGGALKANGFYAPDGAYGFVVLVFFLAWLVATSVLLIVRSDAASPSSSPASS